MELVNSVKLEDSISQNQPVPKLVLTPRRATKKFEKKCARLLPVTVVFFYVLGFLLLP